METQLLLDEVREIKEQLRTIHEEAEATNKILTENTALIKEMLGLWHTFLALMKSK